jgi:hypothetical protein
MSTKLQLKYHAFVIAPVVYLLLCPSYNCCCTYCSTCHTPIATSVIHPLLSLLLHLLLCPLLHLLFVHHCTCHAPVVAPVVHLLLHLLCAHHVSIIVSMVMLVMHPWLHLLLYPSCIYCWVHHMSIVMPVVVPIVHPSLGSSLVLSCICCCTCHVFIVQLSYNHHYACHVSIITLIVLSIVCPSLHLSSHIISNLRNWVPGHITYAHWKLRFAPAASMHQPNNDKLRSGVSTLFTYGDKCIFSHLRRVP